MQTVWIAGGAGFIGSHLSEHLLNNGFQVVCLDNFITSGEENIVHLKENPNFTFIHQDIINFPLIEAKKLPKPDFIFHLASPASPNKNSKRSYIAYPIETLQVNSLGTYNLLEAAKNANARFLFASTSEIYGDPSISPQPETYFGNVNPNGVRSVYDEGKRFGEAITMAYVRKFNVDARMARIFNTYGPKMQIDDGRVVSNFIIEALKNEPLTVYGKGEQTRSFCYVSDMVEGLTRLMLHDGIPGAVVNLGNPIEKKIVEFATIVKDLTKTTSDIVFEELPEDDPKQRRPDITRAKEILHWEPKVDLMTGLEKTIAYFKQIV
ncbi:MAG TPA: UDP-glucuronic acid decarboxylase family protein [Patescibacteria group bacterium]